MEYIAHITEEGKIQTVKEHLDGTAEYCQKFADAFGSGSIGKFTGQIHDIGKYSTEFQKHIRGCNIFVDHSTAGAYESYKLKNNISAFCIMGHHSGLPDIGGRADREKSTFYGRCNGAQAGYLKAYDKWKEEIYVEQYTFPSFLRARDGQQQAFFTRMLFSCLVDADFLDTEHFMKNFERENDYDTIEELISKLSRTIAKWKNPTSELNKIRSEILNACIEAGKVNSTGMFSLTVPTGGGKTIASLAFALYHARKNNLKRVIYVIPYTSIIEQTAETFRQILGERNVLEHHSGISFDMNEQEDDPMQEKLKMASENWDIPVIVTTSVQFFESIYSNKSSKCRKLHNISESVIIFDEAQMIPLSQLKPCINAIARLVENYRVSAVLCTATQPALNQQFESFIPQHPILMKEICPENLYNQDVFKRVCFENIGTKTWPEMADMIKNQEQALCIVNNRKSAQNLYELLLIGNEEKDSGVFHLTTMMYPEHRRKMLAIIRDRLTNHQRCLVVATSLIEAGVDVDFPCVYRELAGLDSILQAGGRCNREGLRTREQSIVSIFKSEAKIPAMIQTNVQVTEEIMREYEQISSPEAISAYFKILRNYLSSDQAQDKYGILKMDPRNFKQIAKQFKMIDSSTYTIYIPFDEGKRLIEAYHYGEKSRSLMRKLGRYGVPVYINQLQKLLETGAITPLDEIDTGSYVLLDTNLYSEKEGLIIDVDYGNAFFI